MEAIVAVSEDWGIGADGDMLFHLHGDLKHFKDITMGHTVFMGRKTLEALPGKKGLPGRKNYVLTRNSEYTAENCHMISSLEGMDFHDAFCIGGASVFAQLLDQFDRIYVTKIFATLPAQVYFPNLDEDPAWKVESTSEVMEEDGISYQYVTYVKKQ